MVQRVFLVQHDVTPEFHQREENFSGLNQQVDATATRNSPMNVSVVLMKITAAATLNPPDTSADLRGRCVH